MEKNKRDYTYIFVLLGTVTFFLLFVLYMKYFNQVISLKECIIYKKLGIYCPGCGGTRAVYSLYNGQVLKSLYYNPLVLYIILVDAWYLITEGIAKMSRKENKFFVKNIRLYLWVGLVILILNWGVKLVMQVSGMLM